MEGEGGPSFVVEWTEACRTDQEKQPQFLQIVWGWPHPCGIAELGPQVARYQEAGARLMATEEA